MLSGAARTLKAWIKGLPYPLFLRVFYLWWFAGERRRARRARGRNRVPLLTHDALVEKKKSDTLFVLGSGPSINRITADRWQAIAAHDSLGLNFWVLHPFVPKYYLFESVARDEAAEAAGVMLEAFARRAGDYAHTIKVAMELHHRGRQVLDAIPREFRENLYAAYSVPAPARDLREFEFAIAFLARRKIFSAREKCHSLFKYAASLTTAIALGAKLDYRRIVLCGVDLNRQDYFFQDAELFPETANASWPKRDEPHDTNVPLEWRLPAEQVVPAMKRLLLAPRGIELYIENPNSALCPAIPTAPAEIFLPI